MIKFSNNTYIPYGEHTYSTYAKKGQLLTDMTNSVATITQSPTYHEYRNPHNTSQSLDSESTQRRQDAELLFAQRTVTASANQDSAAQPPANQWRAHRNPPAPIVACGFSPLKQSVFVTDFGGLFDSRVTDIPSRLTDLKLSMSRTVSQSAPKSVMHICTCNKPLSDR